MESIVGVVSLIFIVAFIYSFFQSFDILSALLDFTIPQKVIRKTRWVLGIIAFISTATYIILILKN